jgi:hypothetical protein
MNFTNMIGKKFAFLTVVSLHGKNKHGQLVWLVKCACGCKKFVLGTNLRLGRTKSCGCKTKVFISKSATTHGMSRRGCKSSEYVTWANMIARCYKPSNPSYFRYGAVGITVCDRWMKFINFFEDMGKKPSPLYTIDRIKSNIGYEPGNCKWATKKEQSLNLCHTKVIQIGNERDSIAGWCKKAGISRVTYLCRVRQGWLQTEALTAKKGSKRGKNK